LGPPVPPAIAVKERPVELFPAYPAVAPPAPITNEYAVLLDTDVMPCNKPPAPPPAEA
jgi:hypothetical protein